MTGKSLLSSIGQADDKYIAELISEKPPRHKPVLPYIAAAAAVLAAVMLSYPKAPPLPSGDTPGSPTVTAPPSPPAPEYPAFPEGDYYAVSYIVNDERPEIDFPALMDAVTADTGIENPTVSDYIKSNSEAYNELMSHGDETLFYCLCYSFQHSKELDAKAGAGKADLAFHIVRESLEGDGLYSSRRILTGPPERGKSAQQCMTLFRYTAGMYLQNGNTWLAEQSQGVYEVVRAIVSVPELRFLVTGCRGETVNSRALFNATQAFTWVLVYSGSDRQTTLANPTLPKPPEDVCNEFTVWTLTQDGEGRVRLEFTDASTGASRGSMTYTPSAEELALVPDTWGELTENDLAPAAGFVEVELPD